MFSAGGGATLRLPALPPPPEPAASSAAAELVRDTGRLEAAAATLPLPPPLPRSPCLALLAPPFFPPDSAALLSVASMGPACCASTAAQ